MNDSRSRNKDQSPESSGEEELSYVKDPKILSLTLDLYQCPPNSRGHNLKNGLKRSFIYLGNDFQYEYDSDAWVDFRDDKEGFGYISAIQHWLEVRQCSVERSELIRALKYYLREKKFGITSFWSAVEHVTGKSRTTTEKESVARPRENLDLSIPLYDKPARDRSNYLTFIAHLGDDDLANLRQWKRTLKEVWSFIVERSLPRNIDRLPHWWEVQEMIVDLKYTWNVLPSREPGHLSPYSRSSRYSPFILEPWPGLRDIPSEACLMLARDLGRAFHKYRTSRNAVHLESPEHFKLYLHVKSFGYISDEFSDGSFGFKLSGLTDDVRPQRKHREYTQKAPPTLGPELVLFLKDGKTGIKGAFVWAVGDGTANFTLSLDRDRKSAIQRSQFVLPSNNPYLFLKMLTKSGRRWPTREIINELGKLGVKTNKGDIGALMRGVNYVPHMWREGKCVIRGYRRNW